MIEINEPSIKIKKPEVHCAICNKTLASKRRFNIHTKTVNHLKKFKNFLDNDNEWYNPSNSFHVEWDF